MKRFFRLPIDDMLSAMEPLMTRGHPARTMLPMLATMLVTWFIYVPIHELLHAYGCIWTGGTVEELFIQGKYGGNILKEWFPFVVTGGDYAGQLTKFTRDDDLIYFSTVFAPFLLTVFIGVPLVRLCTRRKRRWLFGSSVVLGLAPFYNVPGDYYEMASILLTRMLTIVGGGSGHPARFAGLRHDDIFTLFPDIITKPQELGLDPGAGSIVFALVVAAIGVCLAVLLAFCTYQLGNVVARVLVGPAPVFVYPANRKRSRHAKQRHVKDRRRASGTHGTG